MTIRILNAEPVGFDPEARQILRGLGELVEEPLTQNALARSVENFDVLWIRLGLDVNREVLSVPRLRVVVSPVTGTDHIDLVAAEEFDKTILSLAGEGEFLETVMATAEHTWALLLALARSIPWAFKDVLQGGWDRDGFRGIELKNRRLGILGLGRVGRQVARYGNAFDMQVRALDPTAAAWPEYVVRSRSLEDLLRQSDVLTIHVPLGEGTRGLLDLSKLRLLPRGAILINTSRGAIVDEEAVVTLLKEGHLAGAALDVLVAERSYHARWGSELMRVAREDQGRLLITPHLGGATQESMSRTEIFMARKLRKLLESDDSSVGRQGA